MRWPKVIAQSIPESADPWQKSKPASGHPPRLARMTRRGAHRDLMVIRPDPCAIDAFECLHRAWTERRLMGSLRFSLTPHEYTNSGVDHKPGAASGPIVMTIGCERWHAVVVTS